MAAAKKATKKKASKTTKRSPKKKSAKRATKRSPKKRTLRKTGAAAISV